MRSPIIRINGSKFFVHACKAKTLAMDEGLRYYHLRVTPVKGGKAFTTGVDHLHVPKRIQAMYSHIKPTETGHF